MRDQVGDRVSGRGGQDLSEDQVTEVGVVSVAADGVPGACAAESAAHELLGIGRRGGGRVDPPDRCRVAESRGVIEEVAHPGPATVPAR